MAGWPAWCQQMWTCNTPTEKGSHIFVSNNNNLPCDSKLNLFREHLFMEICLQEFYWGCSWNGTSEGVWEIGWRREKRWTVMQSQQRLRLISKGALKLKWPLIIVPNWSKEVGCLHGSTYQPLEGTISWNASMTLGGAVPVAKDNIPKSWRNQCFCPQERGNLGGTHIVCTHVL